MLHNFIQREKVPNPITVEEILNSDIMALSWKQPFADMMIQGKIETRLWPTNYRGLVLICSSAKEYSYPEIEAITGNNALYKLIQFSNRTEIKCRMFAGRAIAVGRLVDCYPMQPEDEYLTLVKYKKPWVETMCRGKHKQFKMVERQVYCHVYEDVTAIVSFNWKGTQGWKKLIEEDKKRIIPIYGV